MEGFTPSVGRDRAVAGRTFFLDWSDAREPILWVPDTAIILTTYLNILVTVHY